MAEQTKQRAAADALVGANDVKLHKDVESAVDTDGKQAQQQQLARSIYDEYSTLKRWTILFVISFAAILVSLKGPARQLHATWRQSHYDSASSRAWASCALTLCSTKVYEHCHIPFLSCMQRLLQ